MQSRCEHLYDPHSGKQYRSGGFDFLLESEIEIGRRQFKTADYTDEHTDEFRRQINEYKWCLVLDGYRVQQFFSESAMSKIRILFLSSNPTGTVPLKLDEEVREIEAKIRAAEHRDSLELITKWAVRPDDLLQSLNQHKPHIVHFSGHGSPTEEIILLDNHGKPKSVSKEALVSLFRTLKDNIRVVKSDRPQLQPPRGSSKCSMPC